MKVRIAVVAASGLMLGAAPASALYSNAYDRSIATSTGSNVGIKDAGCDGDAAYNIYYRHGVATRYRITEYRGCGYTRVYNTGSLVTNVKACIDRTLQPNLCGKNDSIYD